MPSKPNYEPQYTPPKQEAETPMHDDLRRLAIGMRNVLLRKYPDAEERRAVQARIMREINV